MKKELYALGYYGCDGAFHIKCSGSKYNMDIQYSRQKPLKKGRRWEIIKV